MGLTTSGPTPSSTGAGALPIYSIFFFDSQVTCPSGTEAVRW